MSRINELHSSLIQLPTQYHSVIVLEVTKGTVFVKVLRDVLCHSTDWLNIFMTDFGMSGDGTLQ